MKNSNIFNVRLSPDEYRKLLDLAEQAGETPSGAMRALLRGTASITPAQPATAIFFETGDAAQTTNLNGAAS